MTSTGLLSEIDAMAMQCDVQHKGTGMRHHVILGLLLASATTLVAVSARATEPATQAVAKSEVALCDPDTSQTYAGVRYAWLGRFDVEIVVGGRWSGTAVLEGNMGCKNDERTAWLISGNTRQPLRYEGFDGFRWMKLVELETPNGDTKHRIVRVTAGPGKAAFLSGVRVVVRDRQGGTVTLTATLKPTSSVVRGRGPIDGGFALAYPEMAGLWAGEGEISRPACDDASLERAFLAAEKNGRVANEMLFRCRKFVDGWLAHADPETGLIPRNLRESKDIWNGRDSAADNYPFMVLTCALTDRELLQGRMRQMLETERRVTSRVGSMPDVYSFSKHGFLRDEVDLDAIIFDASEYVKDGLLPLTEWLGPSPWLDRLLEIEDDIWKYAPVETPYGNIPSTNVEVNGEQLQVLSRLYWLTGEQKYLQWAERLGDYYLLGGRHPTDDFTGLRLRDHGCEIVSGLCELYVCCAYADAPKRERYREPIHRMCDRILEIGRDPRGMLYNIIKPRTGEHVPGICDTWGYNYNGLYAVYMVDGTQDYREAVRLVLAHLPELVDYHWGVADEYADSIEGALNLYNREPVSEAVEWMDSEIHDMWRPQRPDGIVEGWHGDGNSARTAIMYQFWKTQGLRIEPWRRDVRLGASPLPDGRVCVSMVASEPWRGKLIFDRPRHREIFHLPIDYPRINQFPEWFTVSIEENVRIRDVTGDETVLGGAEATTEGMPVVLEPGKEKRLIVDKPPRKQTRK
ncbi:MAG: hypothetical protein D6741_03850 [Planctomycetota bacterium]|nr:MAG: hypothetical protein D6741_03850 [Planctomycetota bacterium]